MLLTSSSTEEVLIGALLENQTRVPCSCLRRRQRWITATEPDVGFPGRRHGLKDD